MMDDLDLDLLEAEVLAKEKKLAELRARREKHDKDVASAVHFLFNEWCETWCWCFWGKTTGATDAHSVDFIQIY
mgnify:CR=1 FL=1